MTNLAYKMGSFMIRQGPSIFTSRPGKLDIVIHKENNVWGAMYDGKRYSVALIFSAEDCQVLRHYDAVPDDILANLKEWGLLTCNSG
jgi:hypothetical protein